MTRKTSFLEHTQVIGFPCNKCSILIKSKANNSCVLKIKEYAELSVYKLFKEYIGGPVFAVLGNHDSNPEAIDAPHSLPGPLGQAFSWNYDQ